MSTIQKLSIEFSRINRISKLGLDFEALSELCGGLDYELMSYSEGADLIRAHNLKKHTGASAFAYVYRDLKIIFYSDNCTYSEKLFCIAHEIGHIHLGHSIGGTTPRLKNSVQADAQEREADEFAYQLLAPLCVLKRCHATTPRKITHLTLLEGTYAEHILSGLANFKPSALDADLLEQYEDFISDNNRRRNRAILDMCILGAVSISAIFFIRTLVIPAFQPAAPQLTPAPVPSVYITESISTPAPLPTIEVIAVPTQQIETYTVYTTMHGTKYHTETCYHIADSEDIKTLPVQTARELGYEPCKTCKPDLR